MKIIFTGYHNPHFLTVTEYIENAIRQQGHQLVVFDPRKKLIPGRLRKQFALLEKYDHQRMNTRLVALAKKEKPDLVIISGGYFIDPQTIKTIAESGIATALWTTDAPDEFQPIVDTAPFYNCRFCQGTEAIELLSRAGIPDANWLPMACDPMHHYPVALSPDEKERYGFDVVFVGSYYPNRSVLLKQLKGLRVGIFGPHWSKAHDEWPEKYTVKDCNLRPAEWIKLFCASKIVIIIHLHAPNLLCYQASPKVFESLACRSFVLVDRQKDVFSIFNDNEHLVGFSDGNDLQDKIWYYLDHPEEREKIAEAGYRVVLKKHTYSHRVMTLLETIAGKKKGREE